MGKIIQIEVPDWIDEEEVKKMINELIRGRITDEDIKIIETMLKDLPKSKIDDKTLKELYYERRVLY